MIDATFVEKIVGTARRPRVEKVDGLEFLLLPEADGGWTHVELEQPTPDPKTLHVHTLQGVVDYLAANRDVLPYGEIVVHVFSPTYVEVIGKLSTKFGRRSVFLRACADDLLPPESDVPDRTAFALGRFIDHEAFLIAVQSRFVESPAREEVLLFFGSIKEAAVKTLTDDRYGQAVSIKQGIERVGEHPVKNPHVLAPFRTFREVEQPISPFVIRLRQDPAGGMPQLALFEADGGKWRLEAIQKVAAFFSGKLPEGVQVIA